MPSSKSRSSFFSSKTETKNNLKPITSTPLTLVCSHFFQIFPWELMLPHEVVVRAISLWDAIANGTSKVDDVSKASNLPVFVGVYHSQGEKAVSQLDASRRDTLCRRLLHALRFAPQPPPSHRSVCIPYPFHTPLIKLGRKSGTYKRKYKYLDFIDLSQPLQLDVGKYLDSMSVGSYPVFLLTFADLLDSSQMVQHLLRYCKYSI